MINFKFLNTLNILYIENDENTKLNFLNMTDDLFQKIICVNNTNDCLSELQNNNIDIIICDIDFSYIEIIRQKDLDIPIILITNCKDDDKLLKVIKYKVNDYLPKNISKKKLINSIQKISKIRHYDKFIKDIQEDLEELITVIDDVALVCKTDLKGNITFVNKFFCETSGYTQEELLGKNYFILSSLNYSTEQRKELNNTIINGKVWEGKMKYISKVNEIFFGYLRIIPIFHPLDNSLKEYMWTSFLSTEEEVEQSEFKKRVTQNIQVSRRINLEARLEIDLLFKELEKCKNIDFIKSSILDEKNRASKFLNQLSYYEKELKNKENQIKTLSQKATVKIKGIVEKEKNIRSKKDDIIRTMGSLKNELNLRNKDINFLNEELDNQISLIEKLKNKISQKESKLGLIE